MQAIISLIGLRLHKGRKKREIHEPMHGAAHRASTFTKQVYYATIKPKINRIEL